MYRFFGGGGGSKGVEESVELGAESVVGEDTVGDDEAMCCSTELYRSK